MDSWGLSLTINHFILVPFSPDPYWAFLAIMIGLNDYFEDLVAIRIIGYILLGVSVVSGVLWELNHHTENDQFNH